MAKQRKSNIISDRIDKFDTNIITAFSKIIQNFDECTAIITSLDPTYLEAYYIYLVSIFSNQSQPIRKSLIFKFNEIITILENEQLQSEDSRQIMFNIFAITCVVIDDIDKKCTKYFSNLSRIDILNENHLKIIQILLECATAHYNSYEYVLNRLLNTYYTESDFNSLNLIIMDNIKLIIEKSTSYSKSCVFDAIKKSSRIEKNLNILCMLYSQLSQEINNDAHFLNATLLNGIRKGDDSRKNAVYILKSILADTNKTFDLESIFGSGIDPQIWNNYFLIIDVLNETQSHLILPALVLIDGINEIPQTWRYLLYELILMHDNFIAVEFGLNYVLKNVTPNHDNVELINCVLNALNNVTLYSEDKNLSSFFNKFFADIIDLVLIANVTWNPVALYYIIGAAEEIISSTNYTKVNNFGDIIIKARTCPNPIIRSVLKVKLLKILKYIYLNFTSIEFLILLDSILEISEPQTGNNFRDLLKEFKFNNDSVQYCFQNNKISHNCFIQISIVLHETQNLEDCKHALPAIIYYLKLPNQITSESAINAIHDKDLDTAINIFMNRAMNSTIIEVQNWAFANLESSKFSDMIQSIRILRSVSRFYCDLDQLMDDASKTNLLDIAFSSKYLPIPPNIIASFKDSPPPNGEQFSTFYLNMSILRSNIINFIEFNAQNVISQNLTLIEIGGPNILKPIMSTFDAILRHSIFIDIIDDFKLIIDRCFKEIIFNRKSESFWKNLTKLIKIIFLNRTSLLFHEKYFSYFQSMILKILDDTNQINGLANIIFEELFTLPVNDLIANWENFYEIHIIGLLYGSVLPPNKHIEMNLCSKLLHYDAYDNYIKYNPNADLFVRGYSISFLYNILKSNLYSNYINQLKETLIKRSLEMGIKKPRYFSNSFHHREKLRIIETIAFILSETKEYDDRLFKTLVEENNQPNICNLIEIILACTMPNEAFSDILNNLDDITTSSTVIQSIFTISFLKSCYCDKSILAETIINKLFHWTMGQNFTTRLYAQISIMKLIERFQLLPKYYIIHESIKKSLTYGNSEKNADLLLKDFRYSNLDYENMLTIQNIFYHIPRITDMPKDEQLKIELIKLAAERINININETTVIRDSLSECEKIVNKKLPSSPKSEEIITNIQTKIIPMKEKLPDQLLQITKFKNNFIKSTEDMDDNDSFILIASLVTRPPNLGGLARTAQIFGVKTFVIDSLRHIENKEFQSVSVTAEKWLRLLEIKVHDVGDYLRLLKEKGYKIVGAEQTAHSKSINHVKFPQKCALLLG